MSHKINEVKAAIAAGVGLLTGLWGWMGWLVCGWIICMGLDWLSGSAAACHDGEWSSNRAREGIWHKSGMVLVVVVAAGADLLLSIVLDNLPMLSLPVEYPGLICPVVLVWYIVTEMGSITENAVHMGAPVPDWLVQLLATSKHAVDKAGDWLTDPNDPNEPNNKNAPR